jgi:hypothetical protein
MSTVDSVGATCSDSWSTSWKVLALPIGFAWLERSRRRISFLRCLFSERSALLSAARRQMASKSSLENGFWI